MQILLLMLMYKRFLYHYFLVCTLHLVSDDSIYEPKKLANYIADNNITFTFIPPTILNKVYNNLKDFNNLKLNKLLVGVQAIKIQF